MEDYKNAPIDQPEFSNKSAVEPTRKSSFGRSLLRTLVWIASILLVVITGGLIVIYLLKI